MSSELVGLVVDIVGSRNLADRTEAQRTIHAAFDLAHRIYPAEQDLWPTVGDEFQAVYRSLTDAVQATTAVRLALPADVDLRFGLGRGEIRHIEPVVGGSIQDGSAWWSARAAIDETHRRQSVGSRYLRSWFIDGARDTEDRRTERLVNAYLLMRDMTISSMKPRERRLALGTLRGRTQADLAMEENISQSAVSQNLARSGASALLAAHELIGEGWSA